MCKCMRFRPPSRICHARIGHIARLLSIRPENSHQTVYGVHLNFSVRTTVHLTDILSAHLSTHIYIILYSNLYLEMNVSCDDIHLTTRVVLRYACMRLATTKRFWFTLIRFAHLHPCHRRLAFVSRRYYTNGQLLCVSSASFLFRPHTTTKLSFDQPALIPVDHFTHYHHFSIPLAAAAAAAVADTSRSFDQTHQLYTV